MKKEEREKKCLVFGRLILQGEELMYRRSLSICAATPRMKVMSADARVYVISAG